VRAQIEEDWARNAFFAAADRLVDRALDRGFGSYAGTRTLNGWRRIGLASASMARDAKSVYADRYKWHRALQTGETAQ